MAGDALFLGWGQVVRGREQLALQVFSDSIAYYAKLQEDGKIDSFQPILLRPHGGDLAGFIMMYGERSKLAEIQASDEFIQVIARAGAVVDNIGVVNASTAEELGRQMGIYGEVAQALSQT